MEDIEEKEEEKKKLYVDRKITYCIHCKHMVRDRSNTARCLAIGPTSYVGEMEELELCSIVNKDGNCSEFISEHQKQWDKERAEKKAKEERKERLKKYSFNSFYNWLKS